MHAAILWTLVGCCLVLALLGAATSALNRTPGRATLVVAGLTEVVAVVQSLVAGIELAAGHPVPSTPTFVGYLVANVIVVPFTVAWAWSDRNRWSGTVIAVGGLTLAVMTARLLQMWHGRA